MITEQQPSWRHRLLALIYPPAMHIRNRLRHVIGHKSIGVSALIHDGAAGDDATRVLLVRHSYRPGWCLPGGGLQRGETPLAVLARELQEEVGLSLRTPPQPFQVYRQDWFGMSDYPILYVVDAVTDVTGIPYLADPLELLEVSWFAVDDLPAETTPSTRARIAEWRGHQPASDLW